MTCTPASTTPRLADLIAGVPHTLSTRSRTDLTVHLVADQLRQHLPGSQILTAEQRTGDPRQ